MSKRNVEIIKLPVGNIQHRPFKGDLPANPVRIWKVAGERPRNLPIGGPVDVFARKYP